MKTFVLAMAALAAAGGLAGCAAPIVPDVYTLQVPAREAAGPAVSGPAMIIDLAPVALPERLRRRQIVLREEGARVQLLERQRWSASLGDELQDALSTALQGRLHAVDVAKGGVAGKPDYRINVEFSRLDARLGGPVEAVVAWSVKPAGAGRGQVCRGRFEQAAAGGSVADVVAAHQGVVALVADAIAASVREVPRGGQAPYCTAG
ncbi:PqiC family protein [Pigmentiphaga sp.]|uniref:PqiC family protein n=1 Tax=Pigmentiphaga sp. TaxID=1977564 RepID=UPI00128D695D|nr:PqiC family protein [Pigmentiphaga sp.]MPS28324.1 membrane integrity-associated transporter subunit PqiC [Alcaligenaceae bacterium SAGV5]MPS50511.1 membrane integrity-associated transporter subunit PqiC [Alcaligenaceae bacterium SAGV3]MPT58340.1 membrane integrity-associated transporter subunit PqiC [Alcaligenaceae bacterium]